MSFLLDENLSPRLKIYLSDVLPGTIHVRDVGLHSAQDEDVWNYAAEHGLTSVSKDSDFRQRSFLFGHPPKVVWIRIGNCSTMDIEKLLRAHNDNLIIFNQDEQASFLALG
jgi:predicted nuclease of predicted toxin-antitoxin system